ncbi:hypothetical protein CLV63_105150 [Murinocardiopsis flavida]|uniref:Uncharacterized protein n=1 Tax=Murinocardiopsis flavida TaxID=645275 RepID=A0A2P8DMN4_9ACTN|nr:hypothetical protein [Murinocardiopsis flavida]PSK98476.1 hypothetical protein CLV63_105150 [Murinocardiopsis flavida]
MPHLSRRTRLLIVAGAFGTAGSLALGGAAYALGGEEPAGYAQIVEKSETSPRGGDSGAPAADKDCPEKDGANDPASRT